MTVTAPVLRTERLWLDSPVLSDRYAVAEYCRDPLFETLMTLPWPYEQRHADHFLYRVVPGGWLSGDELTWAVRDTEHGPLLGIIGWRRELGDIGFWLGAPHRGRGLMTEAVVAVTDWLAEELRLAEIAWECVVGNAASVSVARKAGFEYTGERPTQLTFRDGTHPLAWHGRLKTAEPRAERPGWPV
ncbi:GNAT family N-acetyltransferase [Glaciihabitans sp. INWT7]|nr:GNAT family N-acetyltransferase [Glaciihabitans sp. INWT7]